MKKLFLFASLITLGLAMTAKAEEKDLETGKKIYTSDEIQTCENRDDIKCVKTKHGPGFVVDGIVQEKYPDGTLKKETPYRGGYRYGLERVYYEVKMPWDKPGHIQYENTYKYGELQIRKEYYENGSIKMIINHKDGTNQVYREDGTLRSKNK